MQDAAGGLVQRLADGRRRQAAVGGELRRPHRPRRGVRVEFVLGLAVRAAGVEVGLVGVGLAAAKKKQNKYTFLFCVR